MSARHGRRVKYSDRRQRKVYYAIGSVGGRAGKVIWTLERRIPRERKGCIFVGRVAIVCYCDRD